MATKTKRNTKKTKSLNSSLVNATVATINTTVENGEKWQKLTKKLIKKSKPVRRKQLDMVFDTAIAVKDQVNSGTERMLDLVGVDSEMMDKALTFAKKNPVSKKVMDVAEDIKEKVTENPVVKKVEKTTEDIKTMGTAKLNDIKEDVLEQTKKVLSKGEEMVEDALGSKKPKKQTKRKTTPKGKKVVAEVKKTSAKVAKEVKNSVKTEAKRVEKAVEKAAEVSAKEDLTIIYGIGPKMAEVFTKNGIKTYADLAQADNAKIEAALEEAGPLFKNANYADWKKQAQVGAEGGTEALEKWIARYRKA